MYFHGMLDVYQQFCECITHIHIENLIECVTEENP